jgi:hypothetical protein
MCAVSRTLIAVVVLGVLGSGRGTVAADAARECRFHDATVKVSELGCFDELKHTDDHTYGTRVCLARAANKCSGVMWFWGGDPEGAATLLDDVTCGKAGAIAFFGSHDEGATIHLMDFTGKLASRVLRGKFKHGKETRKVAWKQTKKGEGFDAAAKIRELSKDACTKAAAP